MEKIIKRYEIIPQQYGYHYRDEAYRIAGLASDDMRNTARILNRRAAIIIELHTENQRLLERLQAARVRIENANETVVSVMETNETQSEKIASLQAELGTAQADIARLERELQEARAEVVSVPIVGTIEDEKIFFSKPAWQHLSQFSIKHGWGER